MSLKIKQSVLGADDLEKALAGLVPKAFNPAARKGVDDGTKLVLAAARARVPERTKSLKKALGRKVAAFRSGGGYVGIVGPRRDPSEKKAAEMRAEFDAGKRKKAPTAKYRRTVPHQGREMLVNPVKYAHLVEFGRRAVVPTKAKVMSDGTQIFGRTAAPVPPHPFMRPAYEQTRSRCVTAILARLAVARRKAVRG